VGSIMFEQWLAEIRVYLLTVPRYASHDSCPNGLSADNCLKASQEVQKDSQLPLGRSFAEVRRN
jgi:uncharacterized protein YgiB involved in biofilm formation